MTKFREEFPDYPVEDFPAMPEGFEDVSWHNDVCPSIVSDALQLLVWIDYSDESRRELIGGKRFTAINQRHGIEYGTWSLQTDNWGDILREIAARRAGL